jgi:hypothetical protein
VGTCGVPCQDSRVNVGNPEEMASRRLTREWANVGAVEFHHSKAFL